MVGEAAIDFVLPDTDGTSRALHEFHRLGPAILLFLPSVYGFRPRWQLWSLLRHYDRFVALGTEVVVVSADPLPELRIFQIHRGFPFVFLADRGGAIATRYQVALREGQAASLIVTTQGLVRFRRDVRFGRRASGGLLLRWLLNLQRNEAVPILPTEKP